MSDLFNNILILLLLTALDKGHCKNCNPEISVDNHFPQEGDRVVIKAQICPENQNDTIHWKKCGHLVGTCVAESCTADNLANNATALQSFFVIEKASIAKDSCFVTFEINRLKLNQSLIIYKHPEFISVKTDGKNDKNILLKNKETVLIEVNAACMFPRPIIKVHHKDANDGISFQLFKSELGATVSDDECKALEASTSTRLEISLQDFFEKSHEVFLLVQIQYGDRIKEFSLIKITLDGAEQKIPTSVHACIAYIVFGFICNLLIADNHKKCRQKVGDGIKYLISNAKTLKLPESIRLRLRSNIQEQQAFLVPLEPSNVFATNIGSNTIDLSWNPPTQIRSSIRKYFVTYNETYLKEEIENEVIGSETELHLQELKPNTLYTIKVSFLTIQDERDDIGIIEVKTQPSAPTGPPQDFCGEPYLDSKSIRLMWKPPHKDKQNGEIKGYTISYMEYDSSRQTYQNAKYVSLDAKWQNGVFGQLKPSTKYYFSVLAFNEKGSGPKALPIHVWTEEDGYFLNWQALFPYLFPIPFIILDFQVSIQSNTYQNSIMWFMVLGILTHGFIDVVLHYKQILKYFEVKYTRFRYGRRKQRDGDEESSLHLV